MICIGGVKSQIFEIPITKSVESQGLIPWVDLVGWVDEKKTLFSEYGHVAYQFKGNEAYNDMLVNTLTIHALSTPGVRSKGQFFFFF